MDSEHATGFPILPAEPQHQKGAKHTATEIAQQPELWGKTFHLFRDKEKIIQQKLEDFLQHSHGQIILTGAGSSAFIGQVLAGHWNTRFPWPVMSIPTTDIVTHPLFYLRSVWPTLLVSFARSGSSPESKQTLLLAENLLDKSFHFAVTCNPAGELAQVGEGNSRFVFLLPPESHDQSLAMTSSFTSMLLTGYLIAEACVGKTDAVPIAAVQELGKRMLSEYHSRLKEIAEMPFTRAVFLGSGSLQGIARESHLKLQELTDGAVMCQYDSYLGFRHGPRAVVDEHTLVVYLLSPNAYVRQYERDLIREVADLRLGHFRLAISPADEKLTGVDEAIVLPAGLPEPLWGMVAVMAAQIIGFYKSLALGLAPDNPSRRGVIARVVQGVNIYDFPNG